MKVGVIDYGVGNLGSVSRSLEELGVAPQIIANPKELRFADRLILPGVGNFTDCRLLLKKNGWDSAITEVVTERKIPLLGICIGMQLLADYGTEGSRGAEPTPGLGLIPGVVKNLKELGCKLRLPHVGWNSIKKNNKDDPLFKGVPDGTDFYFVHSYAFVADRPDTILAFTTYGIQVAAAIRNRHIWGTQFHPEKSSRAGFRVMRNFINKSIC
jgi:glutamine amidotransferase